MNIFFGMIIAELEESKKKEVKKVKPCPRYSIEIANNVSFGQNVCPKVSLFKNTETIKVEDVRSHSESSSRNTRNILENSQEISPKKKMGSGEIA